MFSPPRCPFSDCSSLARSNFLWRRIGRFRRQCDGRLVQRFLCLHCQRSFSVQTFRLDYRLRKPALSGLLFAHFVSKVTQRQSARTLGCNRKTVAHRLALLGRHCQDFHLARLAEAAARGGIQGVFQLDELETFEHERRLKPLTMPVLIERQSFFVLDASVAPLPARGGLTPRYRKKKLALEELHGKRRSGSSRAVERSLRVLGRVHRGSVPACLQTDQKSTYPGLIAQQFGPRAVHERYDSKVKRDYSNPLFPINHTLAQMRDSLSRLVRRNWATTKLAECLELHTWIWIAWRNYVRSITNKAKGTTPAMALGIETAKWRRNELLAWRILPACA